MDASRIGEYQWWFPWWSETPEERPSGLFNVTQSLMMENISVARSWAQTVFPHDGASASIFNTKFLRYEQISRPSECNMKLEPERAQDHSHLVYLRSLLSLLRSSGPTKKREKRQSCELIHDSSCGIIVWRVPIRTRKCVTCTFSQRPKRSHKSEQAIP